MANQRLPSSSGLVPLTESQIREAVAAGRASFHAYRAPGVKEEEITQELMHGILNQNIDRLTHPEKYAVDLKALVPEYSL